MADINNVTGSYYFFNLLSSSDNNVSHLIVVASLAERTKE